MNLSRLDQLLARKLRMVKRCEQGLLRMDVAGQFGTTTNNVLKTFRKYKDLEIRPGSLVAAGLDERTINWLRKRTGIENPTETDLKRWLEEDPARRYYLRKYRSGAVIMDFAIKNLGVEPSLCDLGLTAPGIRLVARLTGKEFPFKSDFGKWFDAHRNKEERERILLRTLGRKGPESGLKSVWEVEQCASRHLAGGPSGSLAEAVL